MVGGATLKLVCRYFCWSLKTGLSMPLEHTAAASPALTVYALAVGMMVAVALLTVGVSGNVVWILFLP
jgi:hypothetical protein